MAMIAAAAAAPAASPAMTAGKPEAQEDAGRGFTDLMQKMSRKDGKPDQDSGQQAASADEAGGSATAQPASGAGADAAAPDILAGLFELPAPTAGGPTPGSHATGSQTAAAQPAATADGAAALIAALAQPSPGVAAQTAPLPPAGQAQPVVFPGAALTADLLPEVTAAAVQSGSSGLLPQGGQRTPSGPVMPSEASLAGLDDEGLISRILKTASSDGGEVPDDADALRLAAGMGKMKVTREETHFAPSLRLSPVEQVGTAIASALGSATRSEAPASDSAAAAFRIRPDAPAVKVLEIQLQPMELGSVKVTMKLTGDAVDVVLTASNPDTAELLKQDRQLLDQMMRATGHKADSITIQAAGDDRPAFQVTGAQPGQGAQGQTGGDGRGAMAQGQFGQAGGGERGAQQQGGGQSGHGTEAAVDGMEGRQNATADDGRSGALYL